MKRILKKKFKKENTRMKVREVDRDKYRVREREIEREERADGR